MTLEIYTKENFFPERLHHKAWHYCVNSKARWGEYDDIPEEPSGCTINIKTKEAVFKKFDQTSREAFPVLDGYELVRMYINVFFPCEYPRWHVDAEKIPGLEAYTVLYYPHLQWERNAGGCTEFWDDGNGIHGSLPLPNRAVCFEATQWHRATTFNKEVRYTFALKYEKCGPDFDFRKYGSPRFGDRD